MALLIKNLPVGKVIWNGFDIIGVTGATLDHYFDECECRPVNGTNPMDYDIVVTDNIKDELAKYHCEDDN